MLKPKPEKFDPSYKKRLTPKPEDIDLSGVVPLKRRKSITTPPPKAVSKKREDKNVKSISPEVMKSRTPGVHKSISPELHKLWTYEVQSFKHLKKLDVLFTKAQKIFLRDFLESVEDSMPERERDNPEHRRITKNSIIRVLVEIARQLEIKVDASHFRNERDLLLAVFEAIIERSSEVMKSRTPELQKS